MKIRAVIIDDIQDARDNIKLDVETYCPNVEIIGEADGVVSGAKLVRELKPDVLFLDIQMQDGTGFDLLEIIGTNDFKVIFTTASDEYAIRAFRMSAIDYLLKPIDPDELVEAVNKISTEKTLGKDHLEILNEGIKDHKAITRLALNTLEKIHIIDIADIVRCESSVNYTTFYLADKTRLMVTKTLKEYDELLTPVGFIRVHQTHLVNSKLVKEFVKIDGGYLLMKDGTSVPVSTRKKQSVVELLSH
ncbi:MAG: two-component system LytT family response regulator [Saprospiraceae bacterium]|jgi:two-component system LytT family response regulator